MDSVRGLRPLRPGAGAFDGRFFERDPRFWPIAAAASAFAGRADWPEPSEYGLAFFEKSAPVRFERSAPRRKTPGVVDLESMYDACILRGVVPTRERHWHDFLNALVWATFPRAKLALHRRQHALIRAWVPPGATQLPNARTPQQDALAVIDEGGIVLLRQGEQQLPVPFGHAFFEGLVLGANPMITRGIIAPVASLPPGPGVEAIDLADQALAALVETPLVPAMLPRYKLLA